MTKKKTISPDDALDLFALFKDDSDNDAEENGKWVDLNEVTSFKIRAASSKVVQDKIEALQKPYLQMIRAKLALPEEKQKEIGNRIIAEAMLVDWKGVNNADKVAVDYSGEEAYAIVSALPKLAAFILGYSNEGTNFTNEDAVADATKNS